MLPRELRVEAWHPSKEVGETTSAVAPNKSGMKGVIEFVPAHGPGLNGKCFWQLL